ncbi:MAG: CDP-glycerol glycerophosphotransferase family protein [Clostridia bacterium]|nr:CDP-glycerol glycerophosphotransferase family protein [Clostridia bacterium]
MKEKLVFLVKHNSFVQKIYRICGSTIIKFIGLFVRTDPTLIVFISLMGTRFNDSPRAIYEYMKSNTQYSKYKMIWAFEHPDQFSDIPSVKLDSLKFFITALKAGYWISNTQFERGLSYKKKRTKYLYTMHGSAIKLCGNDCPGRKDFDFRSVDYLCVQSDFDKYVFQRSFRARNECFLESGRPCNDVLWQIRDKDKYQMQKQLGLPANKKVILYAPTWRDSKNGGGSYDIKPPIDLKHWEKRLSDEYVVLFRAHHITTKIMNVEFNDFLRNYSDYPEINDLYIASDILITDYSSVMVDFAILERPILCFAYDYDDYLKERGTYFELDEELPNKSCRTQEELLDMITSIDFEEQKARSRRFKEKYDQYGGNGVRTAVQALIGDGQN